MAADDSLDGSFVHIDYPPSMLTKYLQSPDVPINRTSPLSLEDFQNLLDGDGRVINEHELRRAVFKGGVDESIRKEVWEFIFELYPFASTSREREALKAEAHLKYEAMKQRWKTLLAAHSADCISEDERQSIYAKTSGGAGLPSLGLEKQDVPASVPMPSNMMSFLEIQAQVFAGRHTVDIDSLLKSIRIIDKDVPRTDRDHPFFRYEDNPNLQKLRHLLITYAAFQPHVGYAQGMNDIAARFLVVLESEVAAYWCFTHYMKNIESDFVESGMSRNLNLLSRLVEQLDPELYQKLDDCSCSDLMFCHRWLLLSFKREFPWEEGVRLFEILCSHHLELNSSAAKCHLEREKWREFEREGAKRQTETTIDTSYTFDLFLCAAIIIDNRNVIMAETSTDPADMFLVVNSLAIEAELNDILQKGEALFYIYCKRAVVDCFEVIDSPNSSSTNMAAAAPTER